MKYKKRIIIILIFVFGFLWNPTHYYANAIEGKILDEETKQPISGVHILAAWDQSNWLPPFGADAKAPFLVKEAVTDQQGNYKIDGWWKFRIPLGYRMIYSGPTLMYFKYGYSFRYEHNESEPYGLNEVKIFGWQRNSQWDGETITLEELQTEDASIEALLRVFSEISSLYWRSGCHDVRPYAPRIMSMLDTYREKYQGTEPELKWYTCHR